MTRPRREESTTEAAGDASVLFRALANKYRRAVVRSLDETHTPVSTEALATYVAREVIPDGKRAEFIRFRDRAVVKLHHVHLPMLANADVIDVEAGLITPGERFAGALALLERLP